MSVKSDLDQVRVRTTGADLLLADLFWLQPLLAGLASGERVPYVGYDHSLNAADNRARVAALYKAKEDGLIKKVRVAGEFVLVKG